MTTHNPDGFGPQAPVAHYNLHSEEMCGMDSGTIEEPGETKCFCMKARDTTYHYVSIITTSRTFTLLTEDKKLRNRFKRLKGTFQLGKPLAV